MRFAAFRRRVADAIYPLPIIRRSRSITAPQISIAGEAVRLRITPIDTTDELEITVTNGMLTVLIVENNSRAQIEAKDKVPN